MLPKGISTLEMNDLTVDLEAFMEELYDAVGVRVSFSDSCAVALAQTKYQCAFCQRTTGDPALAKRCNDCTAEARERAFRQGGIYTYRCWRGLLCSVIPVTVEVDTMGSLVVSGYISTPERMEQTERIFPDPAMEIRPEEMGEVPFLYYEKIKDVMQFTRLAARFLSESFLLRRAREAQLKAELLQSQTEFLALQNQINPHFLFNTLNSISQLAVLEGAEQTPEAIYALGQLLRRTMKQSEGEVSLRDELRFIREYIRIKQMTGRVAIRYEEELEPGTETFMLPAFTIQPLVENAVNHGLSVKEEGGTVRVKAAREGDSICISVIDDGIGFDPESVKPNHKGELSGLGLTNVYKRLQLIFGDRFKNEAHSAPGQGATITLWMPVEK